MLKLGKNLSWDFEVIGIFRKNAVLNICQYLKGFYTYKKICNIFLKFHYCLLRIPKISEISFWKTQIKNITNTHINRFGHLLSEPNLLVNWNLIITEKSMLRGFNKVHLVYVEIDTGQFKGKFIVQLNLFIKYFVSILPHLS